MEGDLNLSQALGGLRIANQTDDSPPPSPSPSPQPAPTTTYPSGNNNAASSQSQIYIPDLQSLESNSPQTGGVSSNGRQSSSFHSQSNAPLSQTQFGPPQPRPTYPPHSASSSRHSSQIVPSYTGATSPFPPSTPGGGSAASLKYPDYSNNATRISREPSRSSLSGPQGASSSGRTPRERSNTERTYRQSNAAGPSPSFHGDYGARGGSSSSSTRNPYEAEHGIPASSEEWKEKGAAVAVKKETDANGNTVTRVVKKGVKDFNFGRTLGEGSYSTVVAATDRTTLKEYAIKVLDKRHIIKEEKVKYVNIEKNTLNRLGEHPGVVRLYYTFQDERSLYFVLDLATGGELLGTLKRLGTFDEECTRFYAAQILDTIEYMHSKAVIHRDLKPENVLLDEKMHIKITDFGTAKILDPPRRPPEEGEGNDAGDPLEGIDNTKANSFVGTAEYVSPELLTDKAACKASDLWAFGCMVFQLLAGRPPFKAGNEYQTFQKIVNLEYEFPKGFPPVAKDLVERLLVLDPAKRLSIEHIKKHEFFEGVEWGRKLWRQKAPRLKPYVPPPEEPKIIKLGGGSNGALNGAGANGRPAAPPRVITELPPPSQLDIEWSPVLTRANERILKLGNAVVQTSPAPLSPDGKVNTQEAPKKFSRFFGGSTTRKRQRLVMVTSAARVIIAAAGGDDKKLKTEISLQGLGVVVRKVGGDGTMWAIDTRDKCYTFEDPKTPASEWLEQIDRAREMAAVNYPAEDAGYLSPSPSSTITLEAASNGHHHLHQSIAGGSDGHPTERSNKRFSKRNSRHGLAAVF